MSYVRGPGVQHWHSIDTTNSGLLAPQAASVGDTWPTANLAIYVPLMVRHTVLVRKLWWAGANASAAGNFDIGLYTATGTALLRSGSTAVPVLTGPVVWDATDTTIAAGIYYVGLALSSTSDSCARYPMTAPLAAAIGVYTEASALPLPATATFALGQTLADLPIVGMLLTTLVS